ncbi:WD40-repeat-containing domain protein [Jimgerdemannia flammicorona]|uniref:WD40-repeat-containing domain protein n=1 Tax=Jimgerdemannia flammicorona TaxID=994334 RepID=A0A433QU12_9FUNG|nr:WD40-repeat-containing domain protein [Jimgerdemannia flammicorona]
MEQTLSSVPSPPPPTTTSSTTTSTTATTPTPTILPVELIVTVFENLDGISLARCSQVCSAWTSIIQSYDDVLWSQAVRRDLDHDGGRMLWSLRVPNPRDLDDVGDGCMNNTAGVASEHGTEKYRAIDASSSNRPRRTWRDMYRITRNWYTGNYRGYFPRAIQPHHPFPLSELHTPPPHFRPTCVLGIPQESYHNTHLTLTSRGYLVRSNPSYRLPDYNLPSATPTPVLPDTRAILLQDPRTGRVVSHLENADGSDVTCLHAGPRSRWLVTGSFDGSVGIWDLERGKKVKTWLGHRGNVFCVKMNDSVVISGGFDNTIRVWDLPPTHPPSYFSPRSPSSYPTPATTPATPHTVWRGTIDISSFSDAGDAWLRGVWELAVSDTLVACTSDASGPILVFSLLTGTLVYELNGAGIAGHSYRSMCITPLFLLTTGSTTDISSISACINVWDLRTGRLLRRLVPDTDGVPEARTASISDVRVLPDGAGLVVRLCDQWSRKDWVYAWSFEGREEGCEEGDAKTENVFVQEIGGEEIRAFKEPGECYGNAWVCWA